MWNWRQVLVVLGWVALSGCATNFGVPLVDAEHRVVDVPPIDASFPAAPMRVAVYIAPEAANALALSDLRKSANGNLLSYGKLGAGILSGVTEYFPKAFAEVFVISEFPHVLVEAADFDAVVVFESSRASGHTFGTTMMEPVTDVLLNLGIYSPAGERLLGYQVIASPKSKIEWDMNIIRATQRGYQAVPELVRVAVRLALQKFPAKQAYAAALADRERRGGVLTDEKLLEQLGESMRNQIAANAPKVDGTPRDALDWAQGMSKVVNVLTTVGATLSAGLAAVPGAGGLAATSGTLSNMIRNANQPGSEMTQGNGILMEFLGGVTAAAQQRAALRAAGPQFSFSAAPAQICQQLGGLAAACLADQCKAVFLQAAQNLSCSR